MRQSRITFKTAANNYINSKDFAKSTENGYMDLIKILLRHFSKVKLKDISEDDLETFLDSCLDEVTPSGKNGYSRGTRKNIKSVFKQIYDYHVKKKLIKRNIDFSSIVVRSGKPRTPRIPYNKRIIEALRNSITNRHEEWVFDLFELGTLTGMRVQELLGLSDSDVKQNLDGKYMLSIERAVVDHQVKSTKNSYSQRMILLSEKALNIVIKHLEEKKVLQLTDNAHMENGTCALFINYKKRQPWMSSVAYYRELKKLFESAGLQEQYRGLHPTRHTFVTNAVNAGMPDDVISGYIGHTNTETMKKHYMYNSLIEHGRHSSSFLDRL
ncbi:tyrosine-type recombinase/integrase [Vibrio pacinii]|uniref:tyrosine-type recombinase/integrase n=1 Tax=Vibrio pacinii TaxID=170674 RepID=UPI00056E1E34|nr:tyrosine-type recombinase/integrase [Vibrio pacinii]